MPPDLYKQLFDGPAITHSLEIGSKGKLRRVTHVANETPNLIPVIARLSDRDPSVARAWLCDEHVRHIGKQLPKEGGFCGYRNIQMLISFIQATFTGNHAFVGKMPSIIRIQDYIEAGWDQGINPHGRTETGGIKGTRKYIGTSEVSVCVP